MEEKNVMEEHGTLVCSEIARGKKKFRQNEKGKYG